jgi:beta-glucosidase
MLAGALTGIVTLAALLAVTGAASASAQGAVAVPSHAAITKTGPVFGIYGKCVDVRNASSANLTPVQIYTCNGTGAQQWTVAPGPAGYTLHAEGKCLDVLDAATANGTPVEIYTCNGTVAQNWVPLNGELVNPNSGRCLDDFASSVNTTQLQIFDCHPGVGANQTWELPGFQPSATGPVFGIYGKCADVRNASSANLTPVQIYTCNGTGAQQWTVAPGAAGYTLHAEGKCLDVLGAATANGTPVEIYTCNGTVAQNWVPLNGELVNPNSGRCLDDPASSSANTTQLQIFDCHPGVGANQTWDLPS